MCVFPFQTVLKISSIPMIIIFSFLKIPVFFPFLCQTNSKKCHSLNDNLVNKHELLLMQYTFLLLNELSFIAVHLQLFLQRLCMRNLSLFPQKLNLVFSSSSSLACFTCSVILLTTIYAIISQALFSKASSPFSQLY